MSVILTGDRTTGSLHLGHYVGSLKNRVRLQEEGHTVYLLLADMQAMTDNADNPQKVSSNVVEVAMDYLAVGIDPSKTTICVQSALSALYELTVIYLNYVTVARLERNPTVKEEISTRGFTRAVPAGFLCYPAAQAADITGFAADLVPVGADQAPMIEQTNEIVRRINNQVGRPVLVETKALIPEVGRLPGTDGTAKMSKSQGNAIMLSSAPEVISAAVRSMYTDPGHLRVDDPGKVEGNVVFTYLDAFDPDKEAVAELKAHYQRGGLGDMVLKKRLEGILLELMGPIRERREQLAADRDYVMDVLKDGTAKANEVTGNVLAELKEALGLFKFQ